MAPSLCRLSSACLVLVLVVHRLPAQGQGADNSGTDTPFKEGNIVREARQVACARPADGLVMLTLQEVTQTRWSAVANRLLQTCSGNLTFHACFFSESVVKVTGVITDLSEGESRTFTCRAWVTGAADAVIVELGQVKVTRAVQTTKTLETVTVISSGASVFEPPTSQASCLDGERTWSPVLVALAVLIVIVSVSFALLLVVHLRARCDVLQHKRALAATVPNLDTRAKCNDVTSAHCYECPGPPHPACPAPRLPDTRGVPPYLQPLPLTSSCARPNVTDVRGHGQGQGSVGQYDEPWGGVQVSPQRTARTPPGTGSTWSAGTDSTLAQVSFPARNP